MLEIEIAREYEEEAKKGLKSTLELLSMFNSIFTPQLVFRVGEILAKLNKDEEALARVNSGLDAWPNHPALLHIKGAILLKLNRLPQAKLTYREAIGLSPKAAHLYFGLGLVLKKMGQPKEALEEFSRAIEIDSTLTFAYEEKFKLEASLGMTEQSSKDKEAAKQAHIKRARELGQIGDLNCLLELNQALEFDPDDPQVLNQRGLLLMGLSQFQMAEQDIRRALVRQPTSTKLWMILLAIKQNMGQLEQTLLQAYTANPESPELVTEYVKMIISKGQLKEGLELLRAFDKKHENTIIVKNLMALICYNVEGGLEEGVAIAKQLKQIKQEDQASYLLYAEIFEKAGDFPTAVECLDIGLKVNPKAATIIFKKAIIYLGNPAFSGQTGMSPEQVIQFREKHLEQINKAIEIQPTQVDFYVGKLGLMMNFDDRSKEGIEWANKGLALDPKNVRLLCLKSQFHLKLDEHEEALKTINLALEADPSSFEAKATRGNILNCMSRNAEALEDFTSISETCFEPQQRKMYRLGLGMALIGTSNEQRALEEFKKIIAEYPAMYEPWAMCVACYIGLGRYKEAMEAAEEALKLQPNNFHVKVYYAVAHEALGHHDKGLELIDECIKENPEEASSRRFRADILMSMGRYQDAIKEISVSIKFDPKEENSYFNRGLNFFLLKHYDEAIKNADLALGVKPNRADYQMLRAAGFLMKGAIESFLQEIKIAKDLVDANLPGLMGTKYRSDLKNCTYELYEFVESVKNAINGRRLEQIEMLVAEFFKTIECGSLTDEKTDRFLALVREAKATTEATKE